MTDAATTEVIEVHPALAELRLGRVDYLNMFPMHWALDVAAAVVGHPTEVNRAVVAGDLDVACMSSIEYARNADELLLLPSTCVSATGAVGSIFVVADAPLESLDEIWVTPQSATSVALLEVLAGLRGGSPTIHALDGDPAEILAGGAGRGVLLIGDDALRARGDAAYASWTFHDLGERWLAETGLPMVYAVWAIRRDAHERHEGAAAALDSLLASSVERFRSDPSAVVAAAASSAIDEAVATRYLDRVTYAFGGDERRGLLRFLRAAAERGLVGDVPRPRFIDRSGGDVVTGWGADVAAGAEGDRGGDAESVAAAYLATVGSRSALTPTAEEREHVAMCLDLEADGRSRDVDDVLHRALADERIDAADALALLQSDRLVEVGQVAHELRLRRTPPGDVTFIVDRNINYSNICVTDCGFCAFYRRPGDAVEGYVHSTESILEKVRETVALGGTAALMQGGHNPDLGIEWYVELFRAIKAEHPTFHLHALSPPEIQHIARRSKMSIPDVLAELRTAGLDSLPGGGGEVLVDRVRRVMAPKKTRAGDWLDIMRTAQGMGMSTTASLMYGHVELLAERVLHLQRVRDVQDERRGFRSFTSWTFQPGSTPLARLLAAGAAPFQEHLPPAPTPFTYLLTQAVGRIFLDNLDNVQSSWVTQGMKVGQAALMFGANDMGSIMIEENVVSSAGTTYRATTEDFVQVIRAAGYRPVQRDTLYRTVSVH